MAHTVVIFGASGDLTSRKLIPALYSLHQKGRLPHGHADRRRLADEVHARSLAAGAGRDDAEIRRQGIRRRQAGRRSPPASSITRATSTSRPTFAALAKLLDELEGGQPQRRASITFRPRPPSMQPAIANLGAAGLADEIARRAAGRDRKAVWHRPASRPRS